MDQLGIVLLASLDRIAVVAAAVAIGYWGYRLYAAEKQMGLVFLVLAVVLVAGVLVTGGSYLRSMGDSVRIAQSTPPPPAEAPAPPTAAPVPVAAGTPVDAPEDDEAMDAPDTTVPAAVVAGSRVATVTPVQTAPPAAADMATAADATAESDEQPQSAPRLATAAELGGRITSIRSENVSIEWSTETD
jgi:hypothetical protein